ncbi:MAG: copper ion binding protein [Oscillospiraceae bacterium]|nr:copper ion binding protein [Oscillospiraceae bacterium]
MFGKTKITLKIKGMDCEHCVHHVKTVLENLDGVDKVEVSLKKAEAVVTFEKDKTVPAEIMSQAVKEAGYEVA